ncbi:D-glycero-beta-D-manno-heptose-7-phosphate kinase [candidate division TA06 bacterium]|uniref:D-glycero-beta-D-manno-heptose-7-phosphate kinase n=1 Tax=candidate division TA06 bacterium TaxID=2250710 RepID=A0A523UTU5_UNCT6|nr:MAG: D-glycero-beta-D-manno-heptose-7-phosphate kinase [candidate division TA06 bacterium]
MEKKRFAELVSGFVDKKILVIGDLMLDEYLWGRVSRISPEAPVPIVEITSESIRPGGAANVAGNIASLGGKPVLVGVVGDDLSGRKLLDLVAGLGLNSSSIVKTNDRHTTQKSRVIAHSQQVVRVDRENTEPLAEEARCRLLSEVRKNIDGVDGVVLEDYDKGIFGGGLAEEVVQIAKDAGKFCTADPKRKHFFDYKGVSLFKPNQREAEAVLGLRIKGVTQLEECCRELMSRLDGSPILMTRGSEGMVLLDDVGFWSVPALLKEIYDPSGAGDTVIAVMTLAVAAGASLREGAVIANCAASVEVSKFGTAVVTRQELLECGKDSGDAIEGS